MPAGHVRVSIKACAVNYPDVLLIADRYQRRPPRPFAPGIDIAGIVEAVGHGVARLKPGDRVMAAAGARRHGGDRRRARESLQRDSGLAAVRRSRGDVDDVRDGPVCARGLRSSCSPAKTSSCWERRAAWVSLRSTSAMGCGAHVIAAASSETKLAVARAKGADAGVVYPTGTLDKATSKAFAEQIVRPAGARART